MRSVWLGTAAAVAAAGMMACGGGNRGAQPRAGQTVSVAGCIVQEGGAYVLAPEQGRSPSSPVGTTGREQQRYRLIDATNIGVSRWVNREATITGKVEEQGQVGAQGGDGNAAAQSLPAIRVVQLHGGGDCTAQ